MTHEEEVRRGQEAALVLNSPLYQEAFMVMKARMLEEFQKTGFSQSEERDEIWRMMKCLDGLERQLEAVMTTGKLGLVSKDVDGAPH